MQQRTRVPAILDWQLVQFPEDARRTHPRKSIQRDHSDVFPSDAGLHPAIEVLAGENFIEVARYLRQREGMIEAADAAPQISQQSIMGVLAIEVVRHHDPLETLGLEELAENVLEHVHLDAKALQVLGRGLLLL